MVYSVEGCTEVKAYRGRLPRCLFNGVRIFPGVRSSALPVIRDRPTERDAAHGQPSRSPVALCSLQRHPFTTEVQYQLQHIAPSAPSGEPSRMPPHRRRRSVVLYSLWPISLAKFDGSSESVRTLLIGNRGQSLRLIILCLLHSLSLIFLELSSIIPRLKWSKPRLKWAIGPLRSLVHVPGTIFLQLFGKPKPFLLSKNS